MLLKGSQKRYLLELLMEISLAEKPGDIVGYFLGLNLSIQEFGINSIERRRSSRVM